MPAPCGRGSKGEGVKFEHLEIPQAKAAFTLAEVLITLGIIGVVAAMTIPNLIANYQEKVTVNKLQAVYSKLLESFRLMVDENGTVDTYGTTSAERMAKLVELLPNYLSGLSKCTSCMPYSYNSRFDSNSKILSGGTAFSMPNGVVISVINSSGQQCIQDMSMTQKSDTIWASGTAGDLDCGRLHIDLNGKQGPNISDIDYFLFKIVIDGIVPAGSSKEQYYAETFEDQCLGNRVYYDGGYCAAWVLENKNMDYLRCKNLSWKGNRKCIK
ncbi:MAG: type II secretion system GspH family protein [Muribaculaceae bacterium]|nr:type II secretion system GspH family protein [Muribaculaceae bacterium]